MENGDVDPLPPKPGSYNTGQPAVSNHQNATPLRDVTHTKNRGGVVPGSAAWKLLRWLVTKGLHQRRKRNASVFASSGMVRQAFVGDRFSPQASQVYSEAGAWVGIVTFPSDALTLLQHSVQQTQMVCRVLKGTR